MELGGTETEDPPTSGAATYSRHPRVVVRFSHRTPRRSVREEGVFFCVMILGRIRWTTGLVLVLVVALARAQGDQEWRYGRADPIRIPGFRAGNFLSSVLSAAGVIRNGEEYGLDKAGGAARANAIEEASSIPRPPSPPLFARAAGAMWAGIDSFQGWFFGG